MVMAVPGSERFSSRPIDPDTLAAELPASLPVHTVTQEQIDALDPLTYEVVRHRLWSVTDEMGEALKRMSGSPIVTDANDFDFALSDELGLEVQVGLYPHRPPVGRGRAAPERRDGVPSRVLGGEALRPDLGDRPPARRGHGPKGILNPPGTGPDDGPGDRSTRQNEARSSAALLVLDAGPAPARSVPRRRPGQPDRGRDLGAVPVLDGGVGR